MPLLRLELFTEGLDPADREALLEIAWEELRISPGMVSADGNFELVLARGGDPDEAPLLQLGDALHVRVTPERLRHLLRARRPVRDGGARGLRQLG